MSFFIKFLKELNSADSSKSIVLAIILGLIAGFLPTINFFTILIFFIVLILRIPIGLFITSFGIFKIVGFFLDPVFNKIGLYLLTTNILNPFWIFLYNIPFFRWSGFNNTIVMGSLILGIVFGIILYIVLNKFIIVYRKVVFEKLRKNRFLAWLVPEEKKGIIRISGILVLISLIVLISLFFMFFLDPIIKYSLEFSLSKVLHKKVIIESVNASLKNLSVDIKNMQIGDILFDKVYTKLDWNKIVWRKYKIDDLEILAETNKNIYSLIKSSTSNKSARAKNNSFNLNITLPSPKSFLAKQDLESLKAIKKLKKDYVKVKEDLKNMDINKYKNEVNLIKKELSSLKKSKIKTPEDFENLLTKIEKIKSQTNNLIKKVKNDKNILINDKKIISNDLKNLKIALNKDKKNIALKYEMIKNKEYLQFTESILKPQISQYIRLVSNIYEKIKPYFAKKKEEKKYIRAKGIYIKFEDKTKYPDFVLVKSEAKLKTSIAKWNIKAKNISDNQILLAKRGDISFTGKSKFFDVGGDINYLNDVRFNIYGNKVEIKKLDLNIVKIKSLSNIKIKGFIKNNNINSIIFIYFINPKFTTNNEFLKELNGITHFKIIIDIKGKIENPKITINSDLDKYISKIIKNKVDELIKKQTNQAMKILNKKINTSLKGISLNELDLKIRDLNSIKNIKNLINDNIKNIIKSKKESLIRNKIRSLF